MARGDDSFYAELDHAKDEGRGSCCTWWSFLLVFGTLLLVGSAVLIWIL